MSVERPKSGSVTFSGRFDSDLGAPPSLSGVIRANHSELGDSGESACRAIKIVVSIANDSRESRCESPVPLSTQLYLRFLACSSNIRSVALICKAKSESFC